MGNWKIASQSVLERHFLFIVVFSIILSPTSAYIWRLAVFPTGRNAEQQRQWHLQWPWVWDFMIIFSNIYGSVCNWTDTGHVPVMTPASLQSFDKSQIGDIVSTCGTRNKNVVRPLITPKMGHHAQIIFIIGSAVIMCAVTFSLMTAYRNKWYFDPMMAQDEKWGNLWSYYGSSWGWL